MAIHDWPFSYKRTRVLKQAFRDCLQVVDLREKTAYRGFLQNENQANFDWVLRVSGKTRGCVYWLRCVYWKWLMAHHCPESFKNDTMKITTKFYLLLIFYTKFERYPSAIFNVISSWNFKIHEMWRLN